MDASNLGFQFIDKRPQQERESQAEGEEVTHRVYFFAYLRRNKTPTMLWKSQKAKLLT